MNTENEKIQTDKRALWECGDIFLHEDTTRMLFEAAPLGIVIVDDQGKIVLMNRAAQLLFCYTEAEIIGQPLTVLIPEEVRALHLQHCAGYMRSPRVRPMGSDLVLHGRRKDGSNFPVEISLGFSHTPQGLLVIAFVLDVTAQREAEQLRDTMIHTLIHDLRNPLGAIYTGLELLEAEAADTMNDNQVYVIHIALNNARRMLSLINTILEVNQLEKGQISLQPTVFDLHELVAETLTTLAPLVQNKAQHVYNDVSSDLPPVRADVALISRVLENLLGNAIKFTPQNGLIRLTARRTENDPRRLRIEVCDSGPGIPSALLPRLFEKFVSGTSTGRGHGLGLAFCKLAIEAHGEKITAQNSPEGGTSFSFTLPVASTDAS